MPPPERPPFTLVIGRRTPRLDPWVLAAAAVPLVALGVAWTYLAHARLRLGAWPTLGSPGPLALGLEVHHLVALLALNVLMVSPIWTAGVVMVRWALHGTRDRLILGAALAVAAWLGALLVVELDPGRAFAWTFGGLG